MVENSRASAPIATLSLISFIVGAGLVALPFSAFHMSIYLAIPYHIFNWSCAIYSIHLFLKCAEVTGQDSMARIGCEVLGKFSLYLVNSLQIVAFGILPVAYLIIMGQSLNSMLIIVSWVKHSCKGTLDKQWFSVVAMALVLSPWVLKKKFEDLKIIGVLMFSTVILFTGFFFSLCMFFRSSWLDHYEEDEWNKFFKPSFDLKFYASLSTPLVAYGFQSAFFPVYNNLKEKNYSQGIITTILAMSFCFLIYMMVIFASAHTFGEKVCGDVLQNLQKPKDDLYWQGIALKSFFIVILAGHFPYVFLVFKESLLAIVALIFIRGETQNITESAESEEHFQNPHVRSRLVPTDRVQLLSAANEQEYKEREFHTPASKRRVHNELTPNDESEIEIDQSRSFNTNYNLENNDLIQALTLEDTNIETVSNSWRNRIYYCITIFMYLIIVLSACFIHNVEVVIRLAGSIGNPFLNFTFPGLFYFVIMRRHGVNNSWWQLGLALALCIYGTMMGVILTILNIWSSFEKTDENCMFS
ncbi:unnamed protein product [Moneuplotes crassus]|uniref:Amino acid transporter transmembrane domain-containing protein n=1 Tax=Euplotes crassus TaxID=5936 RepID=A0AAD1UAG9_EUPCR|nr:unnamed protein product [Moneuplotes crassus]